MPEQSFLDRYLTPVEDAASRFGKSFSSAVGAPQNASDFLTGPKYAVQHPVDSAKLLYNAADQAQHNEQAKGGIHKLYGQIPLVGPGLGHAADQFQNHDYAGGLGTTLGIAAPLLAGKFAGAGEAPKVSPEEMPAVNLTSGEAPSSNRVAAGNELQQMITEAKGNQPASRSLAGSQMNTPRSPTLPSAVSAPGTEPMSSPIAPANRPLMKWDEALRNERPQVQVIGAERGGQMERSYGPANDAEVNGVASDYLRRLEEKPAAGSIRPGRL